MADEKMAPEAERQTTVSFINNVSDANIKDSKNGKSKIVRLFLDRENPETGEVENTCRYMSVRPGQIKPNSKGTANNVVVFGDNVRLFGYEHNGNESVRVTENIAVSDLVAAYELNRDNYTARMAEAAEDKPTGGDTADFEPIETGVETPAAEPEQPTLPGLDF